MPLSREAQRALTEFTETFVSDVAIDRERRVDQAVAADGSVRGSGYSSGGGGGGVIVPIDPEMIQDVVAAFLQAGTGISLTYNDLANTLTIANTGGGGGGLGTEDVQDIVGALIAGGSNITVTYNDTANTLTISMPSLSADALTDGGTNRLYTSAEKSKLAGIAAGATANDTDANLKNRANHTGTQSADTITDSASKVLMTPAERSKLSGIAAGATANDTDANLKNRANHTGTQAASTISDFTEAVQDVMGATIVAGSNVTVNYNDAGNTLTISATGGGGGGPIPVNLQYGYFEFEIDGKGSVLSPATYGPIPIPYDCFPTQWDVYAIGGGSCSLELWKAAAGSIPASGNKITASAPIGTSSAAFATSTSLTGWDTDWNRRETLMVNLASNTAATKIIVAVYLTKEV